MFTDHASPTGFRVYIKKEHCLSCVSQAQTATANTPLTAQLAKERGYHINWVAETAACAGAGDSTGMAAYSHSQGMTSWTPYCWTAGQCTGVHVQITFPLGSFCEYTTQHHTDHTAVIPANNFST